MNSYNLQGTTNYYLLVLQSHESFITKNKSTNSYCNFVWAIFKVVIDQI